MSAAHEISFDPASYQPPDLSAPRRRALLVGLVGSGVTLVGALAQPAQFFRSYLVAFMLCLGVALGCFAVSLVHHLSRGQWGVMIRRILEAAARTVPFLALLFVPLLFGMKSLYPWADAARVAKDHHLAHQARFMNPGFFTARAVLYFALWIGFAFVLSKLSKAQDEAPTDAAAFQLGRKMQYVASFALFGYGLAATFGAIDWLMSLNEKWFSAIYGIYAIGGQIISAMAFVVLVVLMLGKRKPMEGLYQPKHLHDYGKLLFAFVMLWAYFSISQFLIIWSGNLPEEIGFYQGRTAGGWRWLSLLLVVFHFVVPFLLLLSSERKRDVKRLAPVALLLLVMRWVDLYWLVAPAHRATLGVHWLDLAAPVGLGGLWLWAFFGELGKRTLLPVRDPFLPLALEPEHH